MGRCEESFGRREGEVLLQPFGVSSGSDGFSRNFHGKELLVQSNLSAKERAFSDNRLSKRSVFRGSPCTFR